MVCTMEKEGVPFVCSSQSFPCTLNKIIGRKNPSKKKKKIVNDYVNLDNFIFKIKTTQKYIKNKYYLIGQT